MPYPSSSSFWTSGVPLRDLEITLPLPRLNELPLGLTFHAVSAAADTPALVLINGVAPGSVAEKQLRPGDILRSINGGTVGGDIAVAEELIGSAPGVLRLHVLRPMNAGPTSAPCDDTGFSGGGSPSCSSGAATSPPGSPAGLAMEIELLAEFNPLTAGRYAASHRNSQRPSSDLEESLPLRTSAGGARGSCRSAGDVGDVAALGVAWPTPEAAEVRI